MNTINEETILQGQNVVNEETVVENETAKNQVNEPKPKKDRKLSPIIDLGVGTGAGAAAGVIATLLTSGTIPSQGEELVNPVKPEDDGLTTPVRTDGQLPIAHGVDDSMSFNEAFRVAHDEVGPGGVFEWHGQLYGTYTAAEWRNLSSEERLEYNNHLRIVGTPDYASNVSHHIQPEEQEVVVVEHEEGEHVNHEEVNQDDITIHQQSTDDGEDVEVEVLGVQHIQTEEGQEIAVGGVSVEGHEIYVIDADLDGIGDAAITDLNGDGNISENEIQDISGQNVPMSNFEIPMTGAEDVAIGGEPDYITEGL